MPYICLNHCKIEINPAYIKYPVMKKILLLLVVVCLATGVKAQILATANSPEYKNILKMSASLFTRSTFQMGYERFFKPSTSLFISGGMVFKDSESEKIWGLRTEAQIRFNVYTVINPNQSHRLYFAPYLMNQYFETETSDYYSSSYPNRTDNFNAFGGGMLFGWSFSFANRINLDMYAGGGFRKAFNYDTNTDYFDDNIFEYGYSGIVPRFGIDVGFWF
jgi:hypothetical protein